MYSVSSLFELLYTYTDTLYVSDHSPTLKGKIMAISFALNNNASITVNYDQFFNKFHSYTVDGDSILLSEMDKTDLSIIRKVLVDRYDFYEAARKLRDFIDSLLESGGEAEQPEEPVCPYKTILNETFGITFEEMEDKKIASIQLVEETCKRISALPDFANWITPYTDDKKAEVADMLLEFEFKGSGDYVYAKLVKCGDVWGVHTRGNGGKMTWYTVQCSDVLDALNYVARKYW